MHSFSTHSSWFEDGEGLKVFSEGPDPDDDEVDEDGEVIIKLVLEKRHRYDDQQFELWCDIEEAEDIARRLWKVVTDAKEGKFHAEEGRLAPPPELGSLG